MSFATNKPLIKQHTLYDKDKNSSKRVSFDSTAIQSDNSDEENSLTRYNRRPLEKPNDNNNDDDLLNLFRSELSGTEDDVQIGIDDNDKPSPIPRHSRPRPSSSKVDALHTKPEVSPRSTTQLVTDDLEHTIKSKRHRLPERKTTDEQEEVSSRTPKPEVPPRVKSAKGRPSSASSKSEYEEKALKGVGEMNRKKREITKRSNYLEDSDDEDAIIHSQRQKDGQISKQMKELSNPRESFQLGEYHEGKKQNMLIDSEHSTTYRTRQQFGLNKGKEGDEMICSDEETTMKRQGTLSKNQESKQTGRVPAPRTRKVPQDDVSEIRKSKMEDRNNYFTGDHEVKEEMKKPPVIPRVRKDHTHEVQEKEKTVFSKPKAPKTKLHYLDDSNDDDNDDDDDDDDNEDDDDDDDDDVGTYKKHFRQKNQVQNNRHKEKDEVDGRNGKEKSSGWSSLDDSDEDDEVVGKKVSLFKQERPRSAKTEAENQSNKSAKPRPSPRTKPRQHNELEYTRDEDTIRGYQNDSSVKRVQNQDWVSSKNEYNQKVPKDRAERKRVEKERAERIPPNRAPVVPQRPASAKRRNRPGLAYREEGDITTMFEDHVPEASDVIIRDENQWTHRKDHQRAQSSVTPKRGPMKADRGLEEMTRSPHLRQTTSAHDYNDHTPHDYNDYDLHRLPGKQKASSLTNLNRTGSTEYTNYYGDSEDDHQRRNSLDTETIRQTVYDNWLSRKKVTVKKELSKKALGKQKEEEKAKEQQEKKRSAELAFKSWNEHKAESLKEKQTQLKAKEKEKQEKELEKQLKAKDSKKYFKSWKSRKDEFIKQTHKEKKKEINTQKKKQQEDNLEQTTSAKKSFENWKSKKDELLKQQFKEMKKKEKLVKSKEGEEHYEKTIQNADEFQKWFENKGKPRKRPPPPTLSQRAWVPSSRHTADCIPGAVQPVVLPPSSNRARTMSGTYRGKTKYYDF